MTYDEMIEHGIKEGDVRPADVAQRCYDEGVYYGARERECADAYFNKQLPIRLADIAVANDAEQYAAYLEAGVDGIGDGVSGDVMSVDDANNALKDLFDDYYHCLDALISAPETVKGSIGDPVVCSEETKQMLYDAGMYRPMELADARAYLASHVSSEVGGPHYGGNERGEVSLMFQRLVTDYVEDEEQVKACYFEFEDKLNGYHPSERLSLVDMNTRMVLEGYWGRGAFLEHPMESYDSSSFYDTAVDDNYLRNMLYSYVNTGDRITSSAIKGMQHAAEKAARSCGNPDQVKNAIQSMMEVETVLANRGKGQHIMLTDNVRNIFGELSTTYGRVYQEYCDEAVNARLEGYLEGVKRRVLDFDSVGTPSSMIAKCMDKGTGYTIEDRGVADLYFNDALDHITHFERKSPKHSVFENGQLFDEYAKAGALWGEAGFKTKSLCGSGAHDFVSKETRHRLMEHGMPLTIVDDPDKNVYSYMSDLCRMPRTCRLQDADRQYFGAYFEDCVRRDMDMEDALKDAVDLQERYAAHIGKKPGDKLSPSESIMTSEAWNTIGLTLHHPELADLVGYDKSYETGGVPAGSTKPRNVDFQDSSENSGMSMGLGE